MNITSAQLSSSHACNICNIEFDLRFDLRSHTQQHHNQKALQVPVVNKEEEVVKKLKQAKVEGKMPLLKKEKKIPAVKVVKKVKKEAFLTVKEEVAPVTKKEVPMEQADTITSSPAAKFDEAMMEEYDEDYVEDEFLEELAEKKILSPQKKFNKQNKGTNKQKDGNLKIERQETKKELWGSEEDGGWYASSEKIVARFKLKDLVINLERKPSQARLTG